MFENININIISISNDIDNINKQLSEYNVNYNIYNCFENELNFKTYNLLKISNMLDSSITCNFDLCLLFAYYNIIYNALNNELSHILIFEDNFKLMKNEYLMDFMNYLPYDFDIIQFSILDRNNILEDNFFVDEINNGNYFITTKYNFLSNNGLFLSKEGMEFFINTINKKIVHPYLPIYNSNKKILRHYISTVPIVYLENTDEYSYNNIYSKLDKSLYNL